MLHIHCQSPDLTRAFWTVRKSTTKDPKHVLKSFGEYKDIKVRYVFASVPSHIPTTRALAHMSSHVARVVGADLRFSDIRPPGVLGSQAWSIRARRSLPRCGRRVIMSSSVRATGAVSVRERS